MKKIAAAIILFVTIIGLSRCNTKNDLVSASISDYTNLAVGKYVIYQLDSTITTAFGAGFTVHSYTVKDSIEAQITDNLNRPGFRIVRYTWDPVLKTWNASNTFMAIATDRSYEYVENNLRQVRLMSPITDNFSWKGNSAMSQSPFSFASGSQEYLTWTFSFANTNQPFKVGNLSFDSTVTVVQYDSSNNKPFSSNSFNSYSRSYEVYAKGVGRIFQDLFSWEYQTSYFTKNCQLIHCLNNKCDTTAITCSSDGVANGKNCDSIARAQLDAGVKIVCDTIPGNYYYNGYGVKLSILNYN